MSITVTIRNNERYCRNNGSVTQTKYTCQNCDFNGKQSNCKECGGKGYVAFDNFPYELNMANSNFVHVWNALGLNGDYAGCLDGRTLHATLNNHIPTRETVQKGNGIFFGLGEDTIDRYLVKLKEIAMEAERREEMVCWG